jgi:hypothetical protein
MQLKMASQRLLLLQKHFLRNIAMEILLKLHQDLIDGRELDIMELMELIRKEGDIALFKVDGLRDENQFTFVILSGDDAFESIRCDAANALDAVKLVLGSYLKAKRNN